MSTYTVHLEENHSTKVVTRTINDYEVLEITIGENNIMSDGSSYLSRTNEITFFMNMKQLRELHKQISKELKKEKVHS